MNALHLQAFHRAGFQEAVRQPLPDTPGPRRRNHPDNLARHVVAALLWVCVACGGGDGGQTTGPTTVASVTISPASISVHAGGIRQLSAVSRSTAGEVLLRTVTWATSDTAVATVSNFGLVTGVRAGTVTITATAEGKSGTASATVKPVLSVAFTSIGAGGAHTCALSENGTAYCWGRAESRQLGTSAIDESCETDAGPIVCSTTPQLVGAPVAFKVVVAGSAHSCGLMIDGTAWCWGRNAEGQLGTGNTAPTGAPGPVATSLKFESLDLGSEHTCGIASNGVAYCWGHNDVGQLGDGTTINRATPEPVKTTETFQAIVAGGFSSPSIPFGGFTCALTTGGKAYCWGDNLGGQLGIGSVDLNEHPFPLPVVGGIEFVSITAGLGNHTCALNAAGAAYCWGSNTYGALGDGTTMYRASPVPVSGGLTFTRLVAGGYEDHTCGITASGTAYCWGDNQVGQVGDGTLVARLTPTPVPGALTFTSIDAGFRHTCGRASTGVVYCWGSNGAGQLGTDGPRITASPAKVLGQP